MTTTKEEFERQFTERTQVTVAYLRAQNRIAIPCDCGDESCFGWQMAYPEEIIRAYEAGQRRIAELEAELADVPNLLPLAHMMGAADMEAAMRQRIAELEARIAILPEIRRLVIYAFYGVRSAREGIPSGHLYERDCASIAVDHLNEALAIMKKALS